ncbi:hypothetical protein JOB18_008510 [Solea senegalensis]|uniref:Uncharacterized protein n=1 Tax=Solea senegalensis TaxID=28829 RepID=A0AAV6SQI1_SOLSE|nr:protein C1orf194 homolog [Solea senegalensis]KAG7519419.1 hypothetical protein JOB18_008510 [Solea senegalensis]
MSGRNPFSSPKFEEDLTLSGFRPQQRKTYQKPTHMAQTDEPWSRLHDKATFASTQRSVMLQGYQAPNDSLDFQLKSVYDHNKDFFPNKNQILYQKATLSEENRKPENINCQDKPHMEDEDTRVWVDPQRRSIYSIK